MHEFEVPEVFKEIETFEDLENLGSDYLKNGLGYVLAALCCSSTYPKFVSSTCSVFMKNLEKPFRENGFVTRDVSLSRFEKGDIVFIKQSSYFIEMRYSSWNGRQNMSLSTRRYPFKNGEAETFIVHHVFPYCMARISKKRNMVLVISVSTLTAYLLPENNLKSKMVKKESNA